MQLTNQVNISHHGALQLVNKAVNFASKANFSISVCVIDSHGRVKAKVTMDNASLIADELVEKKARTALLGLSSADFADAVKDVPPVMHSMLALADITALGGGLPIIVDGQIVGALAVGGALPDQDIACAQHALKK